jgi:hypothetical protein
MIGFVDAVPRVEPKGGGFLVTFTSGDDETSFALTLHAMMGLCQASAAAVRGAQTFEPTPFQRKHGGKA